MYRIREVAIYNSEVNILSDEFCFIECERLDWHIAKKKKKCTELTVWYRGLCSADTTAALTAKSADTSLGPTTCCKLLSVLRVAAKFENGIYGLKTLEDLQLHIKVSYNLWQLRIDQWQNQNGSLYNNILKIFLSALPDLLQNWLIQRSLNYDDI